MRVLAVLLCGCWMTGGLPASVRADVPSAIESVLKVDHNGQGHAAAREAVAELSQADAGQLTTILAAMDEANPLAANWLRGAFEAIASKSLKSDAGLPVQDLLAFYHEQAHAPQARRLAYEWIITAEPKRKSELVPQALDDPSPEMRRDAVALLILQAIDAEKAGEQEQAIKTFRRALSGTGDPEHVNQIVKRLEALGETVDLVDHYGLLTEWYLIGPFDNVEMKGFPVEYPPEQQIDLSAAYAGQKGEVRWQKLATEDKEGKFDLAALTEPHKGAIDYVTTTFHSEGAQPVEFRLATSNAWKLWLNGELLFAREEYHRGMKFDQYRVAGKLQAGENRILIKVCQNEQDQPWAQDWSFQFRVCDPFGRALHSAQQVAESDSARRD